MKEWKIKINLNDIFPIDCAKVLCDGTFEEIPGDHIFSFPTDFNYEYKWAVYAKPDNFGYGFRPFLASKDKQSFVFALEARKGNKIYRAKPAEISDDIFSELL